jgi:Asp-tRNA(Asn)/Glu-tRNA(Gln) amidotransferase C subunit
MSDKQLSDENLVRELTRLAGIPISEDEVEEVTNRFNSLMLELDRLSDLDLSDIQPVTVFPDEG